MQVVGAGTGAIFPKHICVVVKTVYFSCFAGFFLQVTKEVRALFSLVHNLWLKWRQFFGTHLDEKMRENLRLAHLYLPGPQEGQMGACTNLVGTNDALG